MSACPNINSTEWKDLVDAYGTADAMTAFIKNNYSIPTVSEAAMIFKQMSVKEMDEILSSSSDEFKLSRARQQNQILEKVSFTANAAQRATISKLQAMNLKYQEFLQKNIDTIASGKPGTKTKSVSSFTGTSEFKGDPSEYEAFKLFGTFVHEVLELAQTRAILENRTIADVYTKEYFDELYENYIKKNPFTIENLSKDEIFMMSQGIIHAVNVQNFAGYKILPEITVFGESSVGTPLVGRLDLLLVDPSGKIKIFDFKTKKLRKLFQWNSITNQSEVSIDSALYEMAMKENSISNISETGISFRQIGARSVYDSWMLQLGVYENMLVQNGIDIVEEKNKTIVSLLYQVDENTKEFKGSALQIFDGENYYDLVRNTYFGQNGAGMSSVDATNEHVIRLRNAIEKEVPTGKGVNEEAVTTRSIDDVYDVTPTEQNIKNFIANIEAIVEGQLSKITEDIENEKSKSPEKRNNELITILSKRRDSINEYKAIVEKLKTTNPSDLLYSTNFANALNIAEDDFNTLLKVSNNGNKIYFAENTSEVNKNKALTQVSEAYNKGILLKQIVDVLEEIVDEAAQAEGSTITPESPVRQKLTGIRMTSNIITSNFKETAMKNAIEILQSMSEKAVAAVSEQQKQAIKVQLNNVNKELYKLKTNPKLGIFNKLKFTLFSLTDKDFKEKFKLAMGPDGDYVLATIEKLERDKIRFEALMEGYDLSDESLEKYINGITDHSSALYPGMQNPLETDTMLSGWNVDSWIASASNSDRLISSHVLFLKEHKAQAEHDVMSDPKIKKVVNNVSSLIESGFTLEQLNEFISEWRNVEYTDPKTGERVKKRVFDIAKPYSEEYENTYKNYSVRLKELNKEIYALKADYNQKFKTDQKDEAFRALQDKRNERDQFNNEYIEWLLANASLPYTDKFYELQLKLPNEIREQIQKLYLEQETILFDVGKGNEALLDEEDFLRLEEIDTEIRKLRLKAQEDNQDYAKYLEELNDLYEYQLNDDAYVRAENDAKRRFFDDPVRMDIWYKTNSVTRPKSEWYEKLFALYEERAELYGGSNDEIKELMDQKRKLMAPYKINGRFNPKFLSEEEIYELDMIESKIEDLIEQSKRASSTDSSIDPAAKKRAKEITDEISTLVSPQLNPIYNEEFKQKYRVLKKNFNDFLEADSKFNAIRLNTPSDSAEYTQAEEEWMLATIAFSKAEKEFEYWYNNYHYDTYEPLSKVQDHEERRRPKSFNFEKLPNSSIAGDYMETVPNPKYYKIKKLRIGNWSLDGNRLTNAQIEELKQDPQQVEDLLLAGRLIAKQGAINEDFLKSPDGIPMPKEIKKSTDGHYYVDPSVRPSQNINEKFVNLMNNPQMFELYNNITDLFFSLQQQTDGRKIGYQVPGIAASVVESFATLGIKKGFDQQYKAFMDKHLKTLSDQDKASNIYGDVSDRIRMKFSNQLSEGIQSTDAIGSVLKWATEAHMNIAMQNVAPKSKAFIQFLELQAEKLKAESLTDTYITNEKGERVKVDLNKKVRELENLIEVIKFENDKHLYGKYESEENRALKKKVDAFFKYTSFIRIGFDVSNQIKNFTSGNVQAWLAAGGSDSDHYTKKDWLFAKGRVYGPQGFLSNYFKDWGKVDDLSDSTLLYRMINPAQKDIIKYYSDIAGGRGRKVKEKLASVGELGYLLQDKGDTEIAVTVMYAVMNKNKYELIESIDPATGEKTFKRDDKGEIIMIPAHEAYVQDANGNLVIRNDVNYDKKEENRLRNIINSEMRRAQGNYASIDQTKFESKILGKMVFFFRKFLIPQFLNRFGYLRPNWEGSEVAMGYWRATARAMKMFGMGNTAKEFFLGSNLMSKIGMSGGTQVFQVVDPNTGEVVGEDSVGDFYSKRIRHARQDAIMMTLLTILAMSLLSYVKRKDDDDEEIGIIEGNAIRVLWGTKAETVSMFPIGEGSNEYVKNFTTAIPFMREATAAVKLGNHALKYGIAMTMNGGEEPDPGYDSEFYQEIWKDAFYTRKYGAYEKGDAKFSKDLVDLTGIKNFRDLVNPQYRIDVLKGKQ